MRKEAKKWDREESTPTGGSTQQPEAKRQKVDSPIIEEISEEILGKGTKFREYSGRDKEDFVDLDWPLYHQTVEVNHNGAWEDGVNRPSTSWKLEGQKSTREYAWAGQ